MSGVINPMKPEHLCVLKTELARKQRELSDVNLALLCLNEELRQNEKCERCIDDFLLQIRNEKIRTRKNEILFKKF